MANIGESGGDSDYVESAKNSPTIPANTPDLEGHISEMEEMHKASEVDLVKLAQPIVLFYRIDELKIPELDDAETELPENHQDNGATPPVNTQPSPLHSPLEYVLVDSAAPPPIPHVNAGNAYLQAQKGCLTEVQIFRAN